MARREDNSLIFDDERFQPNLTPKQIFEQGAFGGTYWRPIYSSVTRQHYKNQHLKYPFLSLIPKELMVAKVEDIKKNKYGVHSGSTLKDWEDKGWITRFDPYGWVQWYCEYFEGRRCEDDDRQIKRWLSFASPSSGRFYRNKNKDKSNVIKQALHHWAMELPQV